MRQTAQTPEAAGVARRVLVVEDDADLRLALVRAVRWLDAAPAQAGSVAEALAQLSATVPGLVISDVRLPDGSGVQVAEAAARLRPVPAVVAISGSASAEEAFCLARLGVRGYLSKPLNLAELKQTLEQALAAPAELIPLVAGQVGSRPLQQVQEEVRRAMVEQALAISGGNRSEASRLLKVSRQAVQQMVRDLDLSPTCSKSEREG